MEELKIKYICEYDKGNPHHDIPVIKARDLLDCINLSVDKGNLTGMIGFSAGLFLMDLKKLLEVLVQREHKK